MRTSEVHEKKLGMGIDAREAESQLSPGFFEDMLNADTEGDIVKKRAGYQQLGGYLPFKVQSIEEKNGLLCFNLDQYVNLSRARSAPITVRGTMYETDNGTPITGDDFNTQEFNTQHYNEFEVTVRREGPSFTVDQENHGHNSWLQHSDIYASLSESNLNNEQVYPDIHEITMSNQADPNSLTATNITLASSDEFIHASFDASTLGVDNYYPTNIDDEPEFQVPTPQATDFTYTMTFDAVAVGLRSSNLIVTVYEKIDANTIQKIVPDDITINNTTVNIDITVPGNSSPEYIYVATAVPDEQVIAGQVTASVQTVTLPNAFPFTGYSIYTLDGFGVRQIVIPDEAIYDDVNQTWTVSFKTSDAVNYQIYYLEQNLQSNQICVTPNEGVLVGLNTDAVELDVYGLDPLTSIDIEDKNHWLTHIDTYRSQGNTELVTSVGGAQYRLEAAGLNTLYPRYTQTLETSQYLAPFFQNQGVSFAGSGRGWLSSDNGFAGPEVTTVAYQSGSGLVRYTLSVPNVDVSNLSGFTDNLDGTYTSALDNDSLTVTNVGYAKANGTHLIVSMTIDTNTDTATVDCSVPAITNSDYDEENAGGYAQIYTSSISLASSPIVDNTFIPGTTIFIAGTPYTVEGNSFSSDEKLYLSGVIVDNEYSAGVFVTGQNTEYVVPVKTIDPAQTVDGFVRGDMLRFFEFDRWQRIKDIVQLPSQVVTLNGNSLEFVGALDALNFEAGQLIMLLTEGFEGGIYEVVSVTSPNTLQLNNTFTATSARLVGKTLQLDEKLTARDAVDRSVGFLPTARWHAIPHADVPEEFTPAEQSVPYSFTGFSTSNQGTVRSTMVSDNLYLTNGEDPVLKYDGSQVSRAGLFRWEGATFIRKADTTTGAIVPTGATVNGATTAGSFTFTANDALSAGKFVSGQLIIDSGGTKRTVEEVDTDTGEIRVDTAFVGTENSLSELSIVKYYFRLNMVDANNNIIGSAVSGSDNNYTIELGEDNTTVGIKMAKPPKLDLFDYDRLEFEIYRTKQDGAIFYKVTTLSVDYSDSNDFVYYEDTTADANLVDSDTLSTSLFGAELATAIDEPTRAKYITSANNRLVLGNLKDSPRADVKIFRLSEELTEGELRDLEFTLESSDGTSITYKFVNQFDQTFVSGDTIDENGNISLGGGGSLGLTAGQWVYIYDYTETDKPADVLGWFKAVGSDQIDFSRSTASTVDLDGLRIFASIDGTIPIVTQQEFNDDDSAYQFAANTGSNNQLLIQSKLVNAINATQYKLGTTYVGIGKTDIGEIGSFTIKDLSNRPFTLTITHSRTKDLFDVASVFVNNQAVSSGTAINSESRVFASRMLVSFPNFAEIFDRPTEKFVTQSQSIIDVNSADGQEITGIIPFFGDSTSQDSRKQDVVICFKENSIYAVNITTRQITKIDSRGIGCNAPSSIAVVPNGIIFADKSGVYRLNRAFDVIWVGKKIDRIWKERVNLDRLDQVTGHIYPKEQQYRLSVPGSGSDQATETLVYEYGDEAQGQVGGWTYYNNIPSTGWASDGDESYFGSQRGRMYIVRNTGTDSDYRDDDQPIDWDVLYRGMDFGAPGIRKVLRAVVSHFRTLKTTSSVTLEIGVDLQNEFAPTSSFTITANDVDGLSSQIYSKVQSIRQNVPRQRGIYFQLRYRNQELDMPVALAGITFHVAGLDYRGITQASNT